MQLLRIAIATEKMSAMQNFYDQVFAAQFQGMNTEAGTFYQGQIGGLALTLVPNSLARVEAKQNRQQLSFLVENIEETLKKATDAGGQQQGEVLSAPEGRLAAVTDPDGNTIEFLQKA